MDLSNNISMEPTALDESEVIYNKKYKKVFNEPIGSGNFGCVYLVKNIFTKKR